MIAFFCAFAVLAVDSGLEMVARDRAKVLLVASEAYATCPANKAGRRPSTLADLVNPPFGKGSFLPNKEKDLHDPWGMLYRQAFELDEKGFVWHCIWTEREVNGEVKRIGYPPKGKK